jgi:molybdate transport system ATP-binding protein
VNFLEVRDISLDLGSFELKGIDLKAEKGDYVALIGPSAAENLSCLRL